MIVLTRIQFWDHWLSFVDVGYWDGTETGALIFLNCPTYIVVIGTMKNVWWLYILCICLIFWNFLKLIRRSISLFPLCVYSIFYFLMLKCLLWRLPPLSLMWCLYFNTGDMEFMATHWGGFDVLGQWSLPNIDFKDRGPHHLRSFMWLCPFSSLFCHLNVMDTQHAWSKNSF